MSIETRNVEGVFILHPQYTRMTAAGGYVENLKEVLESATSSGRLAIAIDLKGVEYTDNAMVGMLAEQFSRLSWYHGKICLFNVGMALHEFLSHTVLDHLIPIFTDEQAVIAHFHRQPRRRRLPGGLRDVLSPAYTLAHRIGMVSERRLPGTRHVIGDRRMSDSRRQHDDRRSETQVSSTMA